MGYAKDKPELCQFLTDTVQEAMDKGDWAKAFEATLGKSGAETPEPPKMDACADTRVAGAASQRPRLRPP